MKIELGQGFHRLKYATSIPCLVSINSDPVSVINGKGTLPIGRVGGVLEIDVPGKDKPKVELLTSNGEDTNDDPPPPPPNPSNFIAMMRHKVRQEMGITRENFAEVPSRYELSEATQWEEDVLEVSEDPAPVEETVDQTPEVADTEEAAPASSD
jgi:hypothetical protein